MRITATTTGRLTFAGARTTTTPVKVSRPTAASPSSPLQPHRALFGGTGEAAGAVQNPPAARLHSLVHLAGAGPKPMLSSRLTGEDVDGRDPISGLRGRGEWFRRGRRLRRRGPLGTRAGELDDPRLDDDLFAVGRRRRGVVDGGARALSGWSHVFVVASPRK